MTRYPPTSPGAYSTIAVPFILVPLTIWLQFTSPEFNNSFKIFDVTYSTFFLYTHKILLAEIASNVPETLMIAIDLH